MDVGFYGKLPSHGDFLRRRTSDAFVEAWDGWLRQCIADSRATLGEHWLEVYLTSPAWRFICAPGACGPASVMGVTAPSVDRVGRYFPLTVVAELPPATPLLATASWAAPFFDEAERLIVETLAADDVDFDLFDDRVIDLAATLEQSRRAPRTVLDPAASTLLTDDAPIWQVSIGSSSHLASVFEQLLSQQLSALYRPLTLWWTEGSANVEPSCLLLRGLPHPAAFAAFLDGAWARHGWPSIPTRVEGERPQPAAVADDDGAPLRFRSAAASDVGKARQNNEDSFMERTEAGIWAVADGLGGHSDGEVASRMTCDALMDFEPDPVFDETIEAARRRLQEVNDHLVRTSEQSLGGATSGSTIVLLLLRGTRAAVLWAGDSRVYRWRAGHLEQLSRDHSLGGPEGFVPGPQQSNIVTRAIGVQPELVLDLYRDSVLAGDRFLLCSDGLTRVVPEAQICALVGQDDIRTAADGLIAATLAAGAPDNVTVLVVEACP